MTLTDKHVLEYKVKPQVVVEVPRVVKIVGSYAENCKGLVFCSTDSVRTFVSCSDRSDSQVFIKNAVSEESKHFNLTSLRFKKEDKWANFAKALISLICKDNSIETGFNFIIDGDLSREVGVATGILLSLNQRLNLNLSNAILQDYVLKACNTVGSEKKTLSEVQTVLFAKENKFMICDTNKGTFEYFDNPFGNDVSLIMIDSSISAEFTKDLFEDVAYNCTNAMIEFKRAYNRDSFISMLDSDFSDRIYPISSESRQICTYLYIEYKSVLKIRKFLKPFDPSMIGTAFSKVQRVISDKLEITCPEIEWLIKRANEISGCYGCTTVLSPNNLVAIVIKTKDVDSFLNKIEDYERIFGLTAHSAVFNPQGSAKVIDYENSADKR